MKTIENFMYANIQDITISDLKKRCTKIHYFGLGFIQIKLGDRQRLHVYTKELPPIVNEEEIHDHRYDFRSLVLHGNFHQELFIRTKGSEYVEEYETCTEIKEFSTDRGDDKQSNYNVIKTGEQWFSTGSSYYISSDCLHRVSSDEAITLLSRGGYTKTRACVLRKNTDTKICPFSKRIDEDTLWSIVETVLHKAQKRMI